MSEKLKPCPFCGSAGELYSDGVVGCTNEDCGAFILVFTPESWSHRPGEATARREALGILKEAKVFITKHSDGLKALPLLVKITNLLEKP